MKMCLWNVQNGSLRLHKVKSIRIFFEHLHRAVLSLAILLLLLIIVDSGNMFETKKTTKTTYLCCHGEV